MWRLELPRSVELDCPTCGAAHKCEVIYDDGEALAAIDTQPCHEDGCTARLCERCPQFACEHCGLAHCLSHAVTLPLTDGAGREVGTEMVCPVCVRKMEAGGELLAAQPEAELVAMMAGDVLAMQDAGVTVAEMTAIAGGGCRRFGAN